MKYTTESSAINKGEFYELDFSLGVDDRSLDLKIRTYLIM